MTVPCLTTKRLLLRPYQQDDFPSFAALNANELVRKHVGIGETLTEAAARMLFDTFANPASQTQVWAAILKQTSEYVGHVFLATPSEDTRPELGFLFDPGLWGRGLATEAARSVLDYALYERGEREVIATVDCEHAAAIRVLEKVEMNLRTRRSDERGDYLVYSIHRHAAA